MPLLWDLERCRADRQVVELPHKRPNRSLHNESTVPQQCSSTLAASKLRQPLLDNGTGEINPNVCITPLDTPGHRPNERDRPSTPNNATAQREVVNHSITNAGTSHRDKSCNDVDASCRPHWDTLSTVRARGHVPRLWHSTHIVAHIYNPSLFLSHLHYNRSCTSPIHGTGSANLSTGTIRR
jgi:hypothetical protein